MSRRRSNISRSNISRNKSFKLKASDIERFFPPGSNILVGLSGGGDSVALLYLLLELSQKSDIVISACHINHRLRGEESQADSDFCDELCDRLEIPLVQVDIEVAELAKSQKIGLEEAGRLARHTLLAEIAEEEDCDLIALAHHADDQAETLLFRLFRGTGPDGLAGIPEFRGAIVRPLLKFSKAEILDYLQANKLKYREDSSNLDDSFARNFIRNSIIPKIETRFPRVKPALVRLSEIQSAESDFLEELTEKRRAKCVKVSPGGTHICNLKHLNRETIWLKRRILRSILDRLAGIPSGVDFETIDRLLELTRKVSPKESGALSLPGALGARVERGELFIFRQPGVKIKKRTVSVGQKTELPEISSYIQIRAVVAHSAPLKRQPGGMKVFINPEALKGKLSVRSMKTGDRFSPLGMKGSKALGDFFTDNKVARSLRGEIPVLADQSGIIWVAGHQIAERVKLEKHKTKKSRAGEAEALEVKIVRRSRNKS